MYAIVDIETTGGHASAHGITEIAIILHDGQKVEGQYQTLINPLMPIPRYITSLTGINDAMVASAPLFPEVAKNVFNLLKDRVFVAHNVNFDYSFVRHHLSAAGYNIDVKKLCTVRLGRKVFKGMPSYSLGNLCRELGIAIENRHRAGGDAMATAVLLERMIAADQEGHLQKMLKQGSREGYLPMQLQADDIARLPYSPGVYYFYDSKGKVIYVGKALSLRKRVTSHFSNNSPSRRKQELARNVSRISFEECGSEFTAAVFESIEIKRLWPKYNFSQKKWEHSFGLYSYEDQRGILRLGIERKRKNSNPVFSFHLLMDGHQVLRKLIRDFSLCPKYSFLQKSGDCSGIAEGYCRGICEHNESIEQYNERVREAVVHLRENLPSFAIVEKGRRPGEQCYLLLDDGKFYGMGYLSENQKVEKLEHLKTLITPFPNNELIRNMMLRYVAEHPEKIFM